MVINAGETVAIFPMLWEEGPAFRLVCVATRATQMPLFYADVQAAGFCLCLPALIVITKPLSVVYESVRSAPAHNQAIPTPEYQAEMHQMNNGVGRNRDV